jgi:cytoskeletal protein CcmA (bactofilin family)
MFGRKKDTLDAGKIEAAPREGNGEPQIGKPAVRLETLTLPNRLAGGEAPRRLPEYGIAAAPTTRRPEHRSETRVTPMPTPTPTPTPAPAFAPGLHDNDGKKLIVGREIVLSGEIRTCDKLVVEGRVEATLTDSRAIEITSLGQYKGSAQISTADIAGRFEGDLDVKGRLTIRSTGKVTGMIRYGELEIERGGILSGSLEFVAEAASREPALELDPVEEPAAAATTKPEPLLDLTGNLPKFGLTTNGKGAAAADQARATKR